MAGLLSRFTTFIPNATILSNDHNQEFNRIVQLLNGTTTNLKTVLKTSDAGDPPLELDQLSTGPILKGFQGGIEKFRFRNDGGLRIPGIYDSNDNEELLFVATGSAVNEFTMTNAATGNRPALSATGGDANIGISISPKGTGQVTVTGSSPLRLPNVTPSSGDDAARKTYVDDRDLWSAGFFIADPSTFPLNSFSLCQKIIIPGSVTRARDIQLIYNTGSASGSFSVEVRKHPFADQTTQTTLGTLTVNSGAVGVGQSVDIADHTFTSGDYLYVILTARSSPLQRDVSITVTGDKLG